MFNDHQEKEWIKDLLIACIISTVTVGLLLVGCIVWLFPHIQITWR